MLFKQWKVRVNMKNHFDIDLKNVIIVDKSKIIDERKNRQRFSSSQ